MRNDKNVEIFIALCMSLFVHRDSKLWLKLLLRFQKGQFFMRVLTVTSQSDFSELADSLVQFLRIDSLVAVEAQDQDAVATLLKTMTTLRRLWQPETTEILYITDVKGEGDISDTFLRLTLAAFSSPGKDLSGKQSIDEEIQADFDAWQVLPEDNNELMDKIRLHHSESPILSGGDVDAAWDQANDVGEETVGGSTPTPDQDVVEELGEAVGLTYEDDEPLHTAEKLEERDENRWELNPASQDDEESAP
jgi:hypothetical protein